jgi:hypothetical protein
MDPAAATPDERSASPDVVLIAGNAQNGATIMSRALELTPGWLTIGEIGFLWDKGILLNEPCGCGAAFDECPFWRAVGDAAFGGWHRELGEEGRRLRDGLMLQQVPLGHPMALTLLRLPRLRRGYTRRAKRYAELLDRVYVAAAQVAGTRVLVDTMKYPSHIYAVTRYSSLPVRVAHVVRDSRGMTYSGRKTVTKPSGTGTRRKRGTVNSAYRWLWVNAAFDALARTVPTVRVRYEDFVRDPAAELSRITGEAAPFSGRDLTMGENHIVAGNRSRFTRGAIQLREDAEWVEKLPARDRRTITRLTRPLLRRYGYPTDPDGIAALTARVS